MKTNNNLKIAAVIVVIIAIIIVLVSYKNSPSKISSIATSTVATTTSATSTVTANFACADNKTINAQFNNDPSAGTVTLNLSDGRTMTLPHAISADGARYANADESFVFWNKGRGAFVLENNKQTFTGCIQVAPDPGGFTKSYESGSQGFSIRYLPGFTVTDPYTYQELGPGKSINGVKFTIPKSLAVGTNLSDDSYISVEQIPNKNNTNSNSCTADKFLDLGTNSSAQNVTDVDGTTYSVASSTGAGAGNRYEETVYAMPYTNPCMAVRYYIHYGVFQNYPQDGSVKEFDHDAITRLFDKIRSTLIINQ